MRVDLQPAYILHTRPYRDTSLLLDLLTEDFGRITAIARGVRQSKNHKRQLPNLFHRLLITWQGKSELKLLTSFEADHRFMQLQGRHLYSGFYINELLVRLLHECDLIPELFPAYESTLEALHRGEDIEPLLRHFEFLVLRGLGYGLEFTRDCRTSQPVIRDAFYDCDIQEGFSLSGPENRFSIQGVHLLAIAAGDYTGSETRRVAKQLARSLLKPLLGSKPLKSSELFKS